MPDPVAMSTTATLLQALLGTVVVLASLLFLVGVCNANAWIVRRVERWRLPSPPRAVPSNPAASPSAAHPSDAPDDTILFVLAAAAAHILEVDVEHVVIVDIQPYSHWQMEGRLAIHRSRLTSKAISAPAFPARGGSR